MRKWIKRVAIALFSLAALFFLVVLPVGGSYLLTSSRFRFPEPGPRSPSEVGLAVETVRFVSSDGIPLGGWWNEGESESPVAVFVHGLNRSRLELLDRAARARGEGYGTLLFDLRNHGESGDAYTTLGPHEARDVCAALDFVRARAPSRPVVLWGVSLGASTALLAVPRCGPVDAVIADSAFLSFDETVKHHFRMIFSLPSFPIADLLVGLTRLRMGFSLEEADVERAVTEVPDVPVLFIAGEADRRMPPDRAERLHRASAHPDSQLMIVGAAGHGRAYRLEPERYLATVFAFIERATEPAAGVRAR